MRIVPYTVEVLPVPAQPIAAVRGPATLTNLPKRIHALFDEFYAGFKGKGGRNIVLYPGNCGGEFELQCGVEVETDGNSATPAGTVAMTVYMGPYDGMKPAHQAIHEWARANGRKLAGPSWEVYGHWSDDPAALRTDIFYLLSP
jgi:hypothetical protein